MTDLERLNEALERWREAEATSDGFVLDYEQEIEAHLLAYRDFLANGQRVDANCKHPDLIVQRNYGHRWVTCTECHTDFIPASVYPKEAE